jgi:hypothetical protein
MLAYIGSSVDLTSLAKRPWAKRELATSAGTDVWCRFRVLKLWREPQGICRVTEPRVGRGLVSPEEDTEIIASLSPRRLGSNCSSVRPRP